MTMGTRAVDLKRQCKRRTVVSKSALVVLVVAGSGILAATAQTAGSQGLGARAAKCAKVNVRATPQVNAQTAPNETIKSKVTNCSSATETVTLTQTISGPSVRATPTARRWTITLSPGKTAVRTRYMPYACCGTYKVTDRVLTRSGRQLAQATTSFTFA